MRKLALQRFGLVRYDAFEEMGGQLSFSAAFLDERGDGLLITSINGRTETRTYAKRVTGGWSDKHLTPEERQAIETAFFSEVTYDEAARRLNQPLGTVKTRIRSALGKLRQALAGL